MKVTVENYPTIHRAFELIDADNGCLKSRRIPTRYQPSLEAIEIQLAKLTGEQLETFCTGENTDQETLVTQFQISLAHHFLEEYFNDWEVTTDF